MWCNALFVPQLEALLPAVRECLSALSALRHLGHVELVQADNGPLMVLRRYRCPASGRQGKLERFSQTHGLSLYLAPQSEILEHIHGEAPWYTSDGLTLSVQSAGFYPSQRRRESADGAYCAGMAGSAAGGPGAGSVLRDGNFTLPLATRAAQVVGWKGCPRW